MTSQRTPAPWALIDPAVQLARQASPAAGRYLYSVYGISIRSDVPLPFPMRTLSAWFEIEIHNHEGPIPQSLREEIRFEQNLSSAFDVGSFPDGANYVGLKGLGEILISSDGRSLACYCESESTSESLYVYVLGQALSFALVKNGIEPLHATGVVVHGEAVVFLGDCGFGKSTLAAACLQAGHHLLTDDLLVIQKTSAGFLGYPGPARIKLFPEMASRFLGDASHGVPMNPYTRKLIIPLADSAVSANAVPIRAIYALAHTRNAGKLIQMLPLNQREAFLTLLGSSFNSVILQNSRLLRQFEMIAILANSLPVRKLAYPRILDSVPSVLQSIESDVSAQQAEVDACSM